MDIIFDKKPGETHDIFASLWVMNNYDFVQDIRKSLGIEKNIKLDEALTYIINSEKVDINSLTKYFHKEIEPNSIISFNNLWKYSSIDKYLEFLTTINEHELRTILVNVIAKITGEELNKNEITKLSYDNNTVLKYIENKDISTSLKWEIYCILNNSQKYINDFIKFIKNYLSIYSIFDIERKILMDEFNNHFEKNIKKFGVDFIKKETNNVYDFDKHEKICITTSSDIALNIKYNEEENICYVIIGPRIYDIIKNMAGTNEFEKNMAIFRNITDNIKFDIVKLLIHKDYYGLELGNYFQINKVTVSRHMKSLLAAGIVNVKRDGQKIYYSLNKNTLITSIKFLIKELELEI